MNRELVQWQMIDPSNNLVFPWFTHPFLEVLKTWDLKDKVVLEYGAGRSTCWWAEKARFVVAVEANPEFFISVRAELNERKLNDKAHVCLAEVNEGEQDIELQSEYINAPWRTYAFERKHPGQYTGPWDCAFDVIVVDGVLRYECIKAAISALSDCGGKLIVDNWQQDGFICPACAELLAPYEGHVYRQEDHTDHHGNPWQTGYWEIPNL